MNALFLTHDFPYPVSNGGHVYTSNVIEWLGRCGIDTTVFCLHNGPRDEDGEPLENVHWRRFERAPRSRLAQAVSRYPSVVVRNQSAELQAALSASLVQSPPDIVIFDSIMMGWALSLPEMTALLGPAHAPLSIYLSHNVETDLRRQIAENYRGNLPIRWLAARDAKQAGELERDLVRECDVTTVETEEDARLFRKLFGEVNTLLVQPGYDGHYVDARTLDETLGPDVVILGGRLTVMKQVVLDEFLEQASGGLTDSGMNTHVVGPIAESYLNRVKTRYPDIHFHGYVEEVGGLLSRMKLGVVADHVGGGFKHRILTQVFHRVPLVATKEAMAGLPLEPDRDYLAIRDYSEAPAVCARFARDLERLNQIQSNAFERCVEVFSWERTGNDFANSLRELVGASVAAV